MGKYDLVDEDTSALSGQELLEAPGEFSKSLRAGAYGAGSQFNSAAGLVGEALGFDEFAKGRNAAAAELQADAAKNAPRIGSYKQVVDGSSFTNTLRNGVDYATGLVGGSLPIMGAGIVGGLATGGRGAVPAMLGAAGAQLPFNIGDIVQKQQADPEAMRTPVGTRLRDAALGGVASSLVDSAVPGAVASKILGQGAKQAAKQTLLRTVGGNLASIPMEGVTEAGSEAVKQFAANQNKPFDQEALKEAFVGGAAAGTVFTGVGTAADLAHGNAESVRDAASKIANRTKEAASNFTNRDAPGAAPAAQPKKFKTVSEELGDIVNKGRQYADESVDKMMSGQPFVDTAAFATEAGQKFSDNERIKTAAKFVDDIVSDAGLTPERRAQAAAFATDLTDQASQVGLAALKKTVDAGRYMSDTIDGLVESFKSGYNEVKRADVDVDATEIKTPRIGNGEITDVTPIKKSADYSGTNKVIADQLGPVLAKNPGLADRPEAVMKLADSVRQAVETLPSMRLNSDTVFKLIDVLGDQTMTTLARAYRSIKADDPAAAEMFFKKLNEVHALQQRATSIKDFVGGALTEEMATAIKPRQYGELVNGLIKHALGELDNPNIGPHETAARNAEFRTVLKQSFGDKADAVSLAIEKEAKLRKGVEIDPEENKFNEDGGPVTAEVLDTKQFGYGKDNAPVMDSAVFRSTGQQGPDRAAQLLMDVKAKYPDHDVRFERMPGSDMGHVVAKKAVNPDALTEADIKGMRLDTKKYSASPDRIEVGGLILDTRRITKAMDARLPYSQEAQPRNQRMAEMFLEGVARLQEKYGTFDVPDSVVIGQVGEENMTFGDIKKIDKRTDADKANDEDTRRLVEQRKNYKTATKQEKEALAKDAQETIARREKARDAELAAGDDVQSRQFDAAPRVLSLNGNAGPKRIKDVAVQGKSRENPNIDDGVEFEDDGHILKGEDRPDKDAEIHKAASNLSGEKLINRSNMDGTGQSVSPKPFAENLKPARALMHTLRESDLPIGKKIADRLEVLINNAGVMAERDRVKLAGLKPNATPSDVAEIINPIAVKYQDVIQDAIKTAQGNKNLSTKVALPPPTRGVNPVSFDKGKVPGSEVVEKPENGIPRNNPGVQPQIAADKGAKIDAAQNKRTDSDLSLRDYRQNELDQAFGAQKTGIELSSAARKAGVPKKLQSADRIAGEPLGKNMEDAIGRLADRMKRKTDDPKSLAAKKAALLEAASSSNPALLKELSTTDDAAALQRTVAELPPGAAADAANIRMAELVQNPQTAYDLTKKYSFMGLHVHNDLGKSGFAATHDSPIRHEGKFDWRSHQGKGEGNAAFGAGTYLSTADGVHKSYKDQFTAKIAYDAKNALKDDPTYVALRTELDALYKKGIVPAEKISAITSKMFAMEDAVSDKNDKSPTYEVSVDIKARELLDWDAPLSEQSELVQNALAKIGFQNKTQQLAETKEQLARAEQTLKNIKAEEQAAVNKNYDAMGLNNAVDEVLADFSAPISSKDISAQFAPKINEAYAQISKEKSKVLGLEKIDKGRLTGADIYKNLVQGFGSQTKASDRLQSLGILGHKYAASGGKNDTHPNYVIYDDSKIENNYVHFSAQNPGTNPTDAKTRADVADHIEKVLGNSVKLAWAKLTHAGEFEEALSTIRLSVHALDPMSVAYHESLHAFFAHLRKAGASDIIGVLDAAASNINVMSQLTERFKGEPAVLAQLRDSEERAAYMYQLWANGELKIGPQVKGVFRKIADYIRSALGIWSNDERAIAILEHFNSGEYAKSGLDVSALQRINAQSGRNQALETAKSLAEPLTRLADAVLSTGSGRLRGTGNPSLIRLADIIKRDHTDASGGDRGFIPAARMQSAKRQAALAEALKDYNQDELHQAMESLQRGRTYISPGSGRVQQAQNTIKDILADTRSYMLAAGVKIGDLGPDYFPRVWDSHYISKNQQKFKDMLEPYIRSGEMKGSAEELMQNLSARDGNEFGVDREKINFDDVRARPPGMQFKKKRTLDFIKPEDAAEFVSKDLMGTLTTYINQAARKAEWTRRLGNGKLELLVEQAKNEGATADDLKLADTYMRGVDGTLGDNINPHARRIMGNMLVYQNIRLLPFAVFSSIVDPIGVLVRGGTVSDAFETFKRGMMEIPKNLGRESRTDYATEIAELIGVVDSAMLASTLGDVYTQGMVGGFAKKANATFFKYNLMEGLNRSFRIGASEAAIKFIGKHADGTASKNSERWINELGLQAGDVVPTANGRIALTVAEGLTLEQERRVHAAVNQWVDGAVLRPDAADKPIWMNDPHYALISHLKQFTYAFQKTILERTMHEFRHGNYTPAMALASYVPMMLAADFAKGLIQGGGEQPEWKKSWGAGDYLGYATQRAGLFGVGQFGVDAAKDIREGGVGVGALVGPTVEQFADAVQLLGGHKQFGPMLLNAMPANALYKNAFNNDAPDSVLSK